MASTEELEDSLFSSLLSSSKQQKGKRRTTIPQKEQQQTQKLFDFSTDDLLDLLSDGDEQPTTRKAQSNNATIKTTDTNTSPVITSTNSTVVSHTSPRITSLLTTTNNNNNSITSTPSLSIPSYISPLTTPSASVPMSTMISNSTSVPTSTNVASTTNTVYSPSITNSSSISPFIISTAPSKTPTTTTTTTASATMSSGLSRNSTIPTDNDNNNNSDKDSPLVQFGSYIPSTSSRRIRGGPLDLPSPKSRRGSSLSSTGKTVHFETPLIDDIQIDTTPPKKLSNDISTTTTSTDIIRTPPVINRDDDIVINNDTTIKPVAFKHQQQLVIESRQEQQQHLIKTVKDVLKEEMTKRDNVILLKFTQLESTLISEEKRLQDLVKSSIGKVTESIDTLEQEMIQLKSQIENTSQSIVTSLTNELKVSREKDSLQKDLLKIVQDCLSSLKEEQSRFMEKQQKFISDYLNNQNDETDKVKLIDQQQSLEEERKKMSQLLAKLEIQICQKEKDLDKRQWTLSQSEAKVSAKLSAFEEEKQQSLQFLEEQKRLMEKSKEEFLKEQQEVLKRCYSNSLRADIPHVTPTKSQLELNTEREALNDAQFKLKKEQLQLQQDKQSFKIEQEKLQYLESDLNAKTAHASEVAEIGRRMYLQGQKSLEEALMLEQTAKKQFYLLKNYQMELQQKERQLVMEKVNVMRQQQYWNELKSSKDINISPVPPITPPPLTATSTTNNITADELQRMEFSESVQQLLQRIEKDDHTLHREQEFLNIVKIPS